MESVFVLICESFDFYTVVCILPLFEYQRL